MKKQLDVATIANELRGQSAFFPRHRAGPSADATPEQPPPSPPPETTSSPHPVPPVRVVPPVPPVRDVPPVKKRVMKQRWPVYQDQYEALQALALEERKQGGIGSMSAMVREALDHLIATKSKAKK